MKNWKTTLLGLLGGLALIFGQAAQSRTQGGPPITIGNLLPGILIAALGAVAKDGNVTGGTVAQPTIPNPPVLPPPPGK